MSEQLKEPTKPAMGTNQEEDNVAKLLQSAKMHRKDGDTAKAVEEARRAVELDRESCEAHWEQGRALYDMKQYEAAKACFASAAALNPSKGLYASWVDMCEAALGNDVKGHGAKTQTAVPPSKETGTSAAKTTTVDDPEYVKYWHKSDSILKQAPCDASKTNLKHTWFQSQNAVEVDILVKNLDPKQVNIEFQPTTLRVKIERDNAEDDAEMCFNLFAEVDAKLSRYEVLRTKIEIKLVKRDPSVHWPALESTNGESEDLLCIPQRDLGEKANTTLPRKDWTRVADVEIDDDEPVEDQDMLHFFKKLFADADEDTKRAMMKSYQESGGKSLSTNWGDVGSRDFAEKD